MATLRAFIVEDSAVVARSLTLVLQELAGIDVVGTAAEEAEAVQWLAQHDCDLAIVDIFLRHGTGLQVLAAATASNRGIKLIVLTDYATAEMRRRCLALGALRVFDKADDIEAMVLFCEKLAQLPG